MSSTLLSNSGLAHSQSMQLLRAALPHLPAVLVGAWALSCVYSIFLHPLRNIPGSFLAKFTEAWRTYRYARGKWHEDVLHGPCRARVPPQTRLGGVLHVHRSVAGARDRGGPGRRVGKLALGAPIGFVQQATDVMNIIKSIHMGFYQMANFIVSLFTSDFAKFQTWNRDQLARRLAETADEKAARKHDMLDHFIAMKEPDGSPATPGSILIEGGNIIGAGADTTSIGIRTVLAQLLLHPEDYLRVQQEVDQAYAQRPAEDSHSRMFLPYLAVEKLPFLAACVKEALRLHPSILWQLPREAPAAGIEIAGHYIAPSATISMSPLAQNRDRGVYGPSADEWRPSRWIPGHGSTDAEIKQMDKYNVTFGYGPRVCVGKHLATVEVCKFVADFVHRYNARFVNPYWPYVVKSQWFSYQADMFLKLELRDTVSKRL